MKERERRKRAHSFFFFSLVGNWTLTVRMLSISNFSNAVGNFDYLDFHLLQPFAGQLQTLPNTIAALNFDYGGEGVAYHGNSWRDREREREEIERDIREREREKERRDEKRRNKRSIEDRERERDKTKQTLISFSL
jgi:hypothetical protein